MQSITHHALDRDLHRSKEIADEPGMSITVINVYNEALKQKAETYRAYYSALPIAQSKAKKDLREANEALKALEGPYKSARSTVLAIEPEKVLPTSLSGQSTDTDTLCAIKTLVDAVKSYAGQKWADDLLSGELGTRSDAALQTLSASIASKKVLAKAIDDRAQALEPAYDGFIRFKRVVRDTLGSTSKQYMRIHPRANAHRGAETEAGAEANGEAPPTQPPKSPASDAAAPTETATPA